MSGSVFSVKEALLSFSSTTARIVQKAPQHTHPEALPRVCHQSLMGLQKAALPLVAVWLWANTFLAPNLKFSICKVGTKILTLQECWEELNKNIH